MDGTDNRRQRYNTNILKDAQKRSEYSVTLSNKFQVLQELEDDRDPVESQWEKIKETVTSTCQEVLGPKKHQHKEWISTVTLRKIQERKEKKAAVNTSRTRAEKAQGKYT